MPPYIYDPETGQLNTGSTSAPFTGTPESLGFGDLFADTTFAGDWQTYFDPYDTTKETMLGEHADIDKGQLQDAWNLKSGQLGEQYQQQLGNLFGQAGTGMMNLMDSWSGGGQTMTGRKGRQKDLYGREVRRGADKFRLGLKQARDTGALTLQQGISDIYQGLEKDVYGAREDWKDKMQSQMLTMLGWDTYDDDTTPPPPQPTCHEICAPQGSQGSQEYEACMHGCEGYGGS